MALIRPAPISLHFELYALDNVDVCGLKPSLDHPRNNCKSSIGGRNGEFENFWDASGSDFVLASCNHHATAYRESFLAGVRIVVPFLLGRQLSNFLLAERETKLLRMAASSSRRKLTVIMFTLETSSPVVVHVEYLQAAVGHNTL